MSAEIPEANSKRKRRREKLRGGSNCQAGIETPFCPQCGQENAPPDLSINAVVREFLAEIAYFESKLWRTVRALLAHPGRLSTAWSQGRRTSYLSPVRLYLSVTFLFFVGASFQRHRGIAFTTNLSEQDKEEMIRDISKKKLTITERQLAESGKGPLKLSPDQDRRYEAALDRAVSNKKANPGDDDGTSKLDLAGLDKGWLNRQKDKLEAAAAGDHGEFARHYLEEVPKVLFVILPLCALVLKLLYWRQRRTFVEHLVFLLHFHSFAFLVLLPSDLFRASWVTALTVFTIFFWIPGYAFVAMLRFYGQPWWLTLAKSWLLGFAYLVFASFGALLALVFLVASLPDAPAAGNPSLPAPSSGVK